MPKLFHVYTRVHMYFSVYAIKIIKNIYKKSLFSGWVDGFSGSSTTPACGQLIETTWREYKSPSCAWPKRERNFIDIILCWNPTSSLIPHASCTFPDLYRKPLFPGDVHPFICHLECTSLERILARQGRDESGRWSARRSWKDSGDLSTFTTVHAVRNNEEPSCS